jgi:transcriptional regulator with XRE-family HTH domain
MGMIKELLEAEIERRDISVRQAAREIGVAHTTIGRILNDQEQVLNYDTILRIADWLNISPSALVTDRASDLDELGVQIAALLKTEPELAFLFGEAARRVINDRMTREQLFDLVSYASWKFGIARSKEGSDERNTEDRAPAGKGPEQ